VTSWRETYRGLLPDAFLARMSEIGAARRFRRELERPGPHDVVLAALNPQGVFGYVAGAFTGTGHRANATIGRAILPRSPDCSDFMTKEAGNSPISTAYG